MFDDVFKKSLFFRHTKKYQLKFASFYVQGQPGLRMRIWDYSRTRFDATNLIAVSELANELPLKIVFFDGNTIVLMCMKF